DLRGGRGFGERGAAGRDDPACGAACARAAALAVHGQRRDDRGGGVFPLRARPARHARLRRAADMAAGGGTPTQPGSDAGGGGAGLRPAPTVTIVIVRGRVVVCDAPPVASLDLPLPVMVFVDR